MAIQQKLLDHTTSQFLTFILEEEEYGLDILRVQEIRGYEAVTEIPNSPEFVKGVINLRGLIVPIFDLRIKFSLDKADYTNLTVVIILNIQGKVMGIVVDGVSDVVTLSPDQLKPAPSMGSSITSKYFIGFGKLDDRTLILVDIDGLMTSEDMLLTTALTK